MENSSRDGNTSPPYLPPENSVCRPRSNSNNWAWTGSKSGKEYIKALYCHSAYLTHMQSTYKYKYTYMQNARLNEAQIGIKIAGRNINNLRYADDTTLMQESEELKSLLMKVKEESEKVGLKLNAQK